MAIQSETTTVRVAISTREKIDEIARRTGSSKQDIVNRAVEEFMFRQDDAIFAALRSDATKWGVEQRKRAAWDPLMVDDLDDGDVASSDSSGSEP